MHSVENKLSLIRERVFADKMPELDNPKCSEIIKFIRENITTLPANTALRIFGPNPYAALHSAVYSQNGQELFSPPVDLTQEELTELPYVAFTFFDIRGNKQEIL